MIGKIISNYTYKFGRYLARNRDKKWVATLGQNIKSLYYGYENHNYAFDSNGERFLIESLTKSSINTVFDVGANIGSWSKIANKFFPNANIYAFEIVPATYDVMLCEVKSIESIQSHNFGFSNKDEVISINFSRNASSLSGLYDVYHPDPDIVKIDVKVSRLDNYCSSHNINSIDFLKIDTEGMELQVLKGAEGLLKSGAIKVIQFEYGYACIDAGYLLKDIYDYLTSFGYFIGKLYPNYIDFKPYNRMMEDFIGPNFVAVNKKDKRVLDQLGFNS